jgi:acetylornithine deacetylase
MHTAREILGRLVSIPSVTSMPNGPLLDAIEAILAPQDWSMLRQPYIAADGIEKANLVAVPRRFSDRLPEVELLFVCHTDTVPFRKEWEDATELRERNGALHGCGSCDVKGSLAGLLAAALEVSPQAMPAPVGFAFTAEEEIGCMGARKLVSSGAVRPRRVVVCEPTSLRPATAGKGYGLAEVCVLGREAHSAFPDRGISAIQVSAKMIVALEEWQRIDKGAHNPLFDPPHTTFNVGIVHGGSAKNIVAGECKFLVEWRPLPNQDPRCGGEVIERLAKEAMRENPQCSIEVRILRANAGFRNQFSSQLSAALGRILERPETGISFGSEATCFTPVAEEAVVIGPGDMETAHSERECILEDELDQWTEAVKRLLLGGVEAAGKTDTKTAMK